jgi:hypothetical protein
MAKDSSVERLQKKLYAREGGPPPKARRELHEHEREEAISEDWLSAGDTSVPAGTPDVQESEATEAVAGSVSEQVPEQEKPEPDVFSDKRVTAKAAMSRGKRRMIGRVVKAILTASFVFFLVAAGVATYFFVLGNNQVTCDKLPIRVSGPVSIPSGKELVLSVEVTNNNPVPIHDSSLTIDYPEGSRSTSDPNTTLPSAREQINTIESGETVSMTARVVLYGKEHAEQAINFVVEYSIEDSDAVFTCETQSQVVIATAPVALSVVGLEEISSGQELPLTIHVRSNSEQLVPNQRLVVEYPFGYQFLRAEPEPTEGSNVWDIGDLAPGMEYTIQLYGVVKSQTAEARAIRFNLGEGDPQEPLELVTSLQVVEHGLLITRPFLSLDLALNGSLEQEVSVPLGESVLATVQYKNTLSYPLHDVEIEAVLDSSMLDGRRLNTEGGGYYRSVDQTILWSSHTNSDFKELAPGEEGRVGFRFVSKEAGEATGVIEPYMNISFNVRARRISEETEVQQELTSQAQRTVKFITDLMFGRDALYTVGPFTNTGPHPPRVDYETTYTIIWDLANSTNNLENVEVTAVLPVYVRWLDTVDPLSEDVQYNPVTREVRWAVGDMAAGVGTRSVKRSMAFQVAMTPSISQLGKRVFLTKDEVARGVDTFTGDVVEQRAVIPQSTRLINDPYFPQDMGAVEE